jgi:hypothetical protein
MKESDSFASASGADTQHVTRSFKQTKGADVDTSQTFDHPPTVKMEDLVGRTFSIWNFEPKPTKYGDRMLLTIQLPDDTFVDHYTKEGIPIYANVQCWTTARVIKQLSVMTTADCPFYATMDAVSVGQGTSYELADPPDIQAR